MRISTLWRPLALPLLLLGSLTLFAPSASAQNARIDGGALVERGAKASSESEAAPLAVPSFGAISAPFLRGGGSAILNETFDATFTGGPPAAPPGWTQVRSTQTTSAVPDWTRFTGGSVNCTTANPCVYSTDANVGASERYLITPQVTPTASENSLTFRVAQFYTPAYGSVLTVRVSITDNAPASFETVATFTEADIPVGIGAMATKSVDLSAFVGQAIYVAFVHTQSWGDRIYLDDVTFATATPASFTSTTTSFQNQGSFPAGSERWIVGSNVVVGGTSGTIPVTSMTFTTTGTTDTADLVNARLLYSGSSTSFNYVTTPEFGTAIANPNGTITFTGTQALPPGNNYFILVFEASATAMAGNAVDATYESATVSGTARTPTVTTLPNSLTIVSPPPNDNLANATVVTPGMYTGTNVGASAEANETVGTCGSANQAASVWWSYTPADDGTATFDLLGSGFDTVMSLWTGTTFPLTQVGCNDDRAGGGLTSLLSDIPVTGGTTYYIRLVGFSNATGAIELTVTDTTPPTVSQQLSDGAGWRILSAPVTGVTVGTLADLNLVQSVIGQYPDFPSDNLFLDFDGAYVPATNVTDAVTPGQGFFWYLYDEDIDPDDGSFGGGTSQSYTLATRPLTATGPALDADTDVTFTGSAGNTFFMGGNPFATAMTADGVTADVPIQNDLQLYGPNGMGTFTYTIVPRTDATTLSTWQGFFFEQTTAGSDVTVTYLASTRVAGDGTIVGRSAEPQTLALTLTGETTDGRAVADEAAMVRVTDEATTGWDPDDASKLIPPSNVFALLAPVGERDGATYRQAILSVPSMDEPMIIGFVATHPGTYTVSAEALGLEGTTVEFRDIVTGAVSDLATPYTFESDATDWTDRFVLLTSLFVSNENTAITEFALAAPAPNPTSNASMIRYDVPEASTVSVTVYDLLGRRVAVLAEGDATAGQHEARLDANSLAPGVYVVRMQAGSFLATQRVTVIR